MSGTNILTAEASEQLCLPSRKSGNAYDWGIFLHNANQGTSHVQKSNIISAQSFKTFKVFNTTCFVLSSYCVKNNINLLHLHYILYTQSHIYNVLEATCTL